MKPIVGTAMRADYSHANQAWLIRSYNKAWSVEAQRKAPVLATRTSRKDAEAYVYSGGSALVKSEAHDVEPAPKKPLSNGEIAFLIAAGAAALGAVAYALWPKSAEASTTTKTEPGQLSTPANSITVTEQDSGKWVTLAKDGMLTVQLTQPGGTGYAWGFDLQGRPIIAADLDNAKVVGGAAPGSPETVITPFQAIQPGVATLRARLMRGTAVSREFQINITVVGDGGVMV